MKIKLINNSLVKFEAGTIIDVDEQEAKRLIALGNAQCEIESKTVKKGK